MICQWREDRYITGGYSPSTAQATIAHFTVVCLVTWPWIESEAGADLVLIQISMFFICKCKLVTMRTARTA